PVPVSPPSSGGVHAETASAAAAAPATKAVRRLIFNVPPRNGLDAARPGLVRDGLVGPVAARTCGWDTRPHPHGSWGGERPEGRDRPIRYRIDTGFLRPATWA